jgi:hypothetical protein
MIGMGQITREGGDRRRGSGNVRLGELFLDLVGGLGRGGLARAIGQGLPRGLRTQVLVTLVGQAGIAGRLRADRHLAKIEFLRFRHGRFLEHFQGRWGHLRTRKMRQIKMLERRL